jgi:hypothetical protein
LRGKRSWEIVDGFNDGIASYSADAYIGGTEEHTAAIVQQSGTATRRLIGRAYTSSATGFRRSRGGGQCVHWSPQSCLCAAARQITNLDPPLPDVGAEQRNLDDSIAELRQMADGHDDVLAEAVGISAGAWYAWPATRPGFELVAAGS